MLKVPVSNVSPGLFDITCKEIVSEERWHGGTVFRAFVIPTDRLDDLIKGEEARGATKFVVVKTSPPLKQDVSLPCPLQVPLEVCPLQIRLQVCCRLKAGADTQTTA